MDICLLLLLLIFSSFKISNKVTETTLIEVAEVFLRPYQIWMIFLRK